MLASGSVDINDANPDPVVRAVGNGADIVLLAGTLNPAIYTLFAQRDVTSVEVLRGKTVILGGRKDITLYIFDRMVQPHGLQRGDYDTVFAGSAPDRLRALQAGAVQGTILSYPVAFAATRGGFPPLLDSYETIRNLPFSTVSVTRTWLGQEAKRQRIVRFLTAAYRGAQDACAPANKVLMIRLLAEKTRLTDEDARLAYAQVTEARRTYKGDLNITPDELQTVVEYIVAMGDFPAPGPVHAASWTPATASKPSAAPAVERGCLHRHASAQRMFAARLPAGDLVGVPQPRVVQRAGTVRIGFLDLDDDALHHVAALVWIVPRAVHALLL
jgi:ABC-type nitrate/sulfonate/bicarbonate transport system substrate-binding protein